MSKRTTADDARALDELRDGPDTPVMTEAERQTTLDLIRKTFNTDENGTPRLTTEQSNRFMEYLKAGPALLEGAYSMCLRSGHKWPGDGPCVKCLIADVEAAIQRRADARYKTADFYEALRDKAREAVTSMTGDALSILRAVTPEPDESTDKIHTGKGRK